MIITIRTVRVHPEAVLPILATKGAAGYDLVAIEDTCLFSDLPTCVRTGLAFEIPEGWEGQIRPRSGLSLAGVQVINSPATIDADFRGEVKVLLRYVPTTGFTGFHQVSLTTGFTGFHQVSLPIKKGTKIAQIVFSPIYPILFEEVEKLSETERGEEGFGSTGLL